MAKPTVVINGVSYPAVPYVEIPNSGSPGNSSFYYTGDADTAAGNVLSGKKFYNSTGEVPLSVFDSEPLNVDIDVTGYPVYPELYTGTVDVVPTMQRQVLKTNGFTLLDDVTTRKYPIITA